jgi:pimeloyl-ACP methyl ester carboxylesterase
MDGRYIETLRCIVSTVLTIAAGNYYRTRRANFEADRPLLDIEHGVRIKCPSLFVRALKDDMITCEIVGMMDANVPDLTIREVGAGHWLLWEKPREVNAFITEWMEQQGLISTVAP